MSAGTVLEPAERVPPGEPLAVGERLALYFYAGRLRLLAKRYRRGLQREFVHNRVTCEYWAASLTRLTRAAGVLKRWADRSSAEDRRHSRNLLRLLGDAGAALPGLTRVQPHPDAQAHDEAAVWAIAQAYRFVRDACWYLEEWQRKLKADPDLGAELAKALLDPPGYAKAADPAPAPSGPRKHSEKVWSCAEIEQLVVEALRKYRQCERLASGLPPPAAASEDPAVVALQPFLDLCMAGREAFLLEHLLLTLYPAEWPSALGRQFHELHCRAASLMPPGPLRSVSTYRANLHQKYLSPGAPPVEYLRAALDPDYRAGAGPSPAELPWQAVDRGAVVVVAARGKSLGVLAALEGEILPRHAGVEGQARVVVLATPAGDLPETPDLPEALRLVVVDLTTTDRRSWAKLLGRLDSLRPFPLPPSTQSRLAIVPDGAGLPAAYAERWPAASAGGAVPKLRGWFKPTGPVSPPDPAPRLPARPLTALVDRACVLLDSWKVTDRRPRPDPTQIIHPLNQFLQQTKLDVILGTRGPPSGRDSASLAVACRAAFVAVVAAQDAKMGRGRAGVEVPPDFADRLDDLVRVPGDLPPVEGRPGELLAGLILLFTRCLGEWDRPVCRAELAPDGKVELTVSLRDRALPAYRWSCDRGRNPLAAFAAAGLLGAAPESEGGAVAESVKLVFRTSPRISLPNEVAIS